MGCRHLITVEAYEMEKCVMCGISFTSGHHPLGLARLPYGRYDNWATDGTTRYHYGSKAERLEAMASVDISDLPVRQMRDTLSATKFHEDTRGKWLPTASGPGTFLGWKGKSTAGSVMRFWLVPKLWFWLTLGVLLLIWLATGVAL